MAKTKSGNENTILEQVSNLRDPHDWLLQRGVGIILLLYGITLLLNIVAAVTIGLPEGKSRISLAALYDPFYQSLILTFIIMVLQVRTFYHKLRETTRRLLQQKVIVEKEKAVSPNFIQTWQHSLNPRNIMRILFGLIFTVLGIAMIYFVVYQQNLSGLLPNYKMPPPLEAYSTMIYITKLLYSAVIIIVLNAIGNWMYILFHTGRLFRNLTIFFDLKMQPAHPDGSGGFRATGDLFLTMAYIILIPAVFLSVWLILGKQLILSTKLHDLLPNYLLLSGFRNPVRILLGLLITSGVLIFFWPAYALHNFMVGAHAKLDEGLASIAHRAHHQNLTLVEKHSSMSPDEREQMLTEIASLKELYERTHNAPSWPFDRRITIKLMSAQVIPILPFLGLGEPLGKLVEILTVYFQNG